MDSNQTFDAIRKIDNQGRHLPILSSLLVIALIAIAIWFFKGGSFRLYASLFFYLYHLTKLSWLSIMLVSLVQVTAFLPLRFLGHFYSNDIKDFEYELDKTKADDQYFLLNEKVRKGDPSIVFYILNFVLLVIAFVSGGRVFLLEFYRTPIDPAMLYSWVPYPEYPLQGVTIHVPFFAITKTVSLGWGPVLKFWGAIIVLLVVLRLIWTLTRWLLKNSKSILRLRIAYNRILLLVGSVFGTILIVSTYLAFHIPVAFAPLTLSADLSLQNTTFNLITAIASFFATIYLGWSHHRESVEEAPRRNIPENIISKVFKQNMNVTFRNALLLAIFAFYVTRLMPCSHDLSLLAFEALYVISPYTFDAFLKKGLPNKTAAPVNSVPVSA